MSTNRQWKALWKVVYKESFSQDYKKEKVVMDNNFALKVHTQSLCGYFNKRPIPFFFGGGDC
jgi:hypothetical protein